MGKHFFALATFPSFFAGKQGECSIISISFLPTWFVFFAPLGGKRIPILPRELTAATKNTVFVSLIYFPLFLVHFLILQEKAYCLIFTCGRRPAGQLATLVVVVVVVVVVGGITFIIHGH